MMASDHFTHPKNIRMIPLGLLHQPLQYSLDLLLEIPFNRVQLAGESIGLLLS